MSSECSHCDITFTGETATRDDDMTADVFDEDGAHYNERAVDVPGAENGHAHAQNGAGAHARRSAGQPGMMSGHSARPPMTIADIIRARMKANMANQENKAVTLVVGFE